MGVPGRAKSQSWLSLMLLSNQTSLFAEELPSAVTTSPSSPVMTLFWGQVGNTATTSRTEAECNPRVWAWPHSPATSPPTPVTMIQGLLSVSRHGGGGQRPLEIFWSKPCSSKVPWSCSQGPIWGGGVEDLQRWRVHSSDSLARHSATFPARKGVLETGPPEDGQTDSQTWSWRNE